MSDEKPIVKLIRRGVDPYQMAWDAQKRIHAETVESAIPGSFITCQHPHVLTMGRRSKSEHLLLGTRQYEELGASVVEIDRGGDVTYHGPGQLVGYPIVRLKDMACGEDLHEYLRLLEEVLIQSLATWGITAGRIAGKTGVWVDGSKIAAIGVRCSRWVTMHGFAFNVNPDLSWFSRIIPCGLTEPVTSLEKLLGASAPTLQEVRSTVEACFQRCFGCDLKDATEASSGYFESAQ